MGFPEIKFLSWLVLTFLINYYLKKRFPIFKKIGTSLNLLKITLFLFFVHKLTSLVLQTNEISFFSLSALSFGLFLISLFEKRGQEKENIFIKNKKDFYRSPQERAKIKHIASQSQLNHLKKKDNLKKNKFYRA